MRLEDTKKTFDHLLHEMNKVIVGMDEVLKQMLVALLTNSHAILEGYPGLAKTLSIKTMAQLLSLKFSRIQNTPDLMPSDITGTYIIEETTTGKRTFKFQPGPVFANVILADEINRATPKTQSALLEAMQEKQVTLGRTTFKLEKPFFVLATQNPIEQEGTYPLPEAQTDRFLLKIKVNYPSIEEEEKIVDRFTGKETISSIKKVFDEKDIEKFQQYVKEVPIASDLKKRVLKIVNLTRTEKSLIEYGASPRASLGLVLAAKASALISGRNYVSKEDIDKMAYPVLRHRIILNFEAERKGLSTDDAVKQLLDKAR
ncbi:MAG: MoxR family ATPase [Candidatus Woesearchaeota archaeon]